MRYGLDQLPDYGIMRAGTAALQILGFSVERAWRGGVDQQLLSFGDNAPWAER